VFISLCCMCCLTMFTRLMTIVFGTQVRNKLGFPYILIRKTHTHTYMRKFLCKAYFVACELITIMTVSTRVACTYVYISKLVSFLSGLINYEGFIQIAWVCLLKRQRSWTSFCARTAPLMTMPKDL